MDPHTATCFKTYETCRDKKLKTIVYSTAEWTKFSPVIANALTGEVDTHDLDALQSIAKVADVAIPDLINGHLFAFLSKPGATTTKSFLNMPVRQDKHKLFS